jgi:hypothetical protein
MREWRLTTDDAYALRLAADVRLTPTYYADDQVWEVTLGGPTEPAISFQTRYGSRVGLARFVPMIIIEGQKAPIYEAQTFVERPMLRNFAPNYARLTAKPIAALDLEMEVWAAASQELAGRFTFTNTSAAPVNIRLELFGQIAPVEGIRGPEMNILGLDDGTEALHLGKITATLNPVLMLENSIPGPRPVPNAAWETAKVSPKLIAPVTIPAGGSVAIRWVHAGYATVDDSLKNAYLRLYKSDWDAGLKQITALPTLEIETGNPAWDAAIAFSTLVTLRSFISAAGGFPYPTIVSARIPSRGYSAHTDGSDHGRQWNGVSVYLAYLAAPSAAIVAPELAKGVIRDFLAVQKPDGWIDFRPGASGQRVNLLSAPLLAVIAAKIYELTGDVAFVKEVLPGLRKFYTRWFAQDMDRDGDGLPEWANSAQTGYLENPLFTRAGRTPPRADTAKTEAPDLAAYLAREAAALEYLGTVAGDPAELHQPPDVAALWDAARGFIYRDRDTHKAPTGGEVFSGKGDQTLDAPLTLDPPNRLVVRVTGGKDHAPRMTIVIEGVDANGNHTTDNLTGEQFLWGYGNGTAITEKVFSRINYAKFEGLSRVYGVEIDATDLNHTDLTVFAPLILAKIAPEQRDLLMRRLGESYWHPHGLAMLAKNDPAYVPGIDMFWNVQLLEAVREVDRGAALTLFKALLDTEAAILKRDRAFRETWNAETGLGEGDPDELNGVLPLWVILDMIGVRILDAKHAWVATGYDFEGPITVRHSGVTVTRTAQGTTVSFPSGHVIEGASGEVIDPTPDPEPIAMKAPEPTPSVEPAAPPTPVTQAPTAGEPAVIPVNTKRDATQEIVINRKDEGTDDEPPGTIHIPVTN